MEEKYQGLIGSDILFLSSCWLIEGRPQLLVQIVFLYLPRYFKLGEQKRKHVKCSFTEFLISIWCAMKENRFFSSSFLFSLFVCDLSRAPPSGAKVCANKESCWQQIVSAQCWCQGWEKLVWAFIYSLGSDSWMDAAVALSLIWNEQIVNFITFFANHLGSRFSNT